MKLKSLISTLVLIPFALLILPARAANYKYNELTLKDYEVMHGMVESFINKAKKAGGVDGNGDAGAAVEYLREALKLIFSRPNSDNMIAKLVPDVRRELLSYNAFEQSISGIVGEALTAIQSDGTPESVQITAIFILENVLAEIRPEAETNKALRRSIELIRDADVKIPKAVAKERTRRMYKNTNPSDYAKEILKKLEPKKR